MTGQQRGADDRPVERGAAEEASGVPLTPTEEEARRTPPSEPRPERIGSDHASSGQ